MLTFTVGLQKAMDSFSMESVRQSLASIPPEMLAEGCGIISKAAAASLEPATLWEIRGPSVQEIYKWLWSLTRTLFSGPLGPDVRGYVIQTSPDHVEFPHFIAPCHWLDVDSVTIYVNNEIKEEAQPFEFMDYVHGRYENHKVLIKRFKNCIPEVIDQEAYIRGILNGCDITQTLVGVLPGRDITFNAPALVLRCPSHAVPLSQYLDTHCQIARAHLIPLCWSAACALYITHQHDIILNDLDVSHLAVITSHHGDACRVNPKVIIMDLSAATVSKGHRFHKVTKMAAPEVVNGGRATQASDIYSLGVVLQAVAAQFGACELEYAVAWCQRADPKGRPSARELLSYLNMLGELVERLNRHVRGIAPVRQEWVKLSQLPRRTPQIVLRYFAQCTKNPKLADNPNNTI